MNRVLIDTDILSYYFKGNKRVIDNFDKYLQQYDIIEISLITYYEIVGGLLAKNALNAFYFGNPLSFSKKTYIFCQT